MKTSINNYAAVFSGLLMILPGVAFATSGKIGESVGLAYDLDSGELLYRETHCISADGFDHQVIYRDTDDKLIARKLLDYSTGMTTPSFVQHDHNSRESIRVRLDGDAVSMAIIDPDRAQNAVALAQPDESTPVVIDAGFDGFVRQHWDELVSGGSREFQFPFADRASLVELRIQPTTCSYETQSDQCFRLDLSNWFLRALVKPIELGYDAATRRLIRYRGLSNLGDGNGNALQVDIHYSYDDLSPRACQIIEQTLSDGATLEHAAEQQS